MHHMHHDGPSHHSYGYSQCKRAAGPLPLPQGRPVLRTRICSPGPGMPEIPSTLPHSRYRRRETPRKRSVHSGPLALVGGIMSRSPGRKLFPSPQQCRVERPSPTASPTYEKSETLESRSTAQKAYGLLVRHNGIDGRPTSLGAPLECTWIRFGDRTLQQQNMVPAKEVGDMRENAWKRHGDGRETGRKTVVSLAPGPLLWMECGQRRKHQPQPCHVSDGGAEEFGIGVSTV